MRTKLDDLSPLAKLLSVLGWTFSDSSLTSVLSLLRRSSTSTNLKLLTKESLPNTSPTSLTTTFPSLRMAPFPSGPLDSRSPNLPVLLPPILPYSWELFPLPLPPSLLSTRSKLSSLRLCSSLCSLRTVTSSFVVLLDGYSKDFNGTDHYLTKSSGRENWNSRGRGSMRTK